jgi:hypothetical protein
MPQDYRYVPLPASRNRPVGPVRDPRSEAERLQREREAAWRREAEALGLPVTEPGVLRESTVRQRERPPTTWEMVGGPTMARAGGEFIKALDAPPSGMPTGAPYTTPLRMLNATTAMIPKAVGTALSTMRGTPLSETTIDPMAPVEQQTNWVSELQHQGVPDAWAVGLGTTADFLLDPIDWATGGAAGLATLPATLGRAARAVKAVTKRGATGSARSGAVKTGARLTRQVQEAAGSPASAAAGAVEEMPLVTTIREMPPAARPTRVFNAIMEPGATGYTVHPRSGEILSAGTDSTVMVGQFPNATLRTFVIPVQDFKPRMVQDFIKQNTDVFNKFPDAYMGGWVEDGKVYLDVSKRVETVREATKFGEVLNPGATPKPWTAQQKAAGMPRQWADVDPAVVRNPDGTWPRAQEAVADLSTNPVTFTGIRNWNEFVTSPAFQQRLDEMATVGRGAMGESFQNWWDITKGPLARVYGEDMIEKVAGLMASTSPQASPVSNMQLASELIRRAIRGETMRQPNWRAPATAMGDATQRLTGSPTGGFSPKPGAAMPAPNTWENNADLIMAGRGSEIGQDKVNDMRRALLGDLDVAVIDRHYAKLAEDPVGAGVNPKLGIYTSTVPNRIETSMKTGKIENYPVIENEVRTAAERAGVPLAQYSAWVWEGIRDTIRKTGRLYGQPHRASAIPETTTGFNEVFEDLVKMKAQHLGLSVSELERRLRAGNAELLGAVLSTGAGATAYRAWEAEQTAPGAPQAQGTSS